MISTSNDFNTDEQKRSSGGRVRFLFAKRQIAHFAVCLFCCFLNAKNQEINFSGNKLGNQFFKIIFFFQKRKKEIQNVRRKAVF